MTKIDTTTPSLQLVLLQVCLDGTTTRQRHVSTCMMPAICALVHALSFIDRESAGETGEEVRRKGSDEHFIFLATADITVLPLGQLYLRSCQEKCFLDNHLDVDITQPGSTKRHYLFSESSTTLSYKCDTGSRGKLRFFVASNGVTDEVDRRSLILH